MVAGEILSAPMEIMGGDDMSKDGMDMSMEPNDGYMPSTSAGALATAAGAQLPSFCSPTLFIRQFGDGPGRRGGVEEG